MPKEEGGSSLPALAILRPWNFGKATACTQRDFGRFLRRNLVNSVRGLMHIKWQRKDLYILTKLQVVS